jgi:Flp pilus assembly protein TadG
MTTARWRLTLRERWRRVAITSDTGSSTAEAALLTPLLVMVLLFLVLCGRLASAQIDLNAAASSAARAGSLARTEGAARANAQRAALETLAARGVICRQPAVFVTTGGLRPGGAVTVTISCSVRMSDLTLLGVPGSRAVSATATSPIDTWRGVA